MKVNEQVLDSVKVYVPMYEDERYLAWMKRELQLKHQHKLLTEQSAPVFFLANWQPA